MKKQSILFLMGLIVGNISYKLLFDNKVEDKSDAILKTLKSNCKCEQIKQFLYVKGLSTSFDFDETYTETAEYELKNCRYANIKKEVKRINRLLIDKIDGYRDVDRFTIEFTHPNSSKSFTIYNGIIKF